MSSYIEVVKSISVLSAKHSTKIANGEVFEKVIYDWDKLARDIQEINSCPWNKNDLYSLLQFIRNSCESEKNSVYIVQSEDQNCYSKRMPLAYELLFYFYKGNHRKLIPNYYQKIIRLYYKKINKRVLQKISWEDFKCQAATVLPLIKLEEICHPEDNESGTINYSNSLQLISQCPRLNEEDLQEIVKSKFNKKSIRELVVYDIQPISKCVIGYLGEYFTIEIKVNTGTTRVLWESVNLFVKFTKRNLYKNACKLGSKKEIFFYENFVSMLKLHGFDILADFAPEFYFGRTNDCVISENMVILQYETEELVNMLTVGHLELVITQLAKLHGSSFMLENILWKFTMKRLDELYPEYFQELILSEELIKFYMVGLDGVKYTIDKYFEEISQKVKNKHNNNNNITKFLSIEEFKDKLEPEFFEKLKKSYKYTNVLCHADLHSPNLLFKYDDQTKTPVDCKLIDFQSIRYCPPLHDVLFAIYTNTNKEIRDDCMDQLLEKYHILLTSNLEKFNYNINELFTEMEFKESCQYLKPQAIVQTLLYSHFKRCPKGIKANVLQTELEWIQAEQIDRRPFLDEAFKSLEFESLQKELLFDLYECLCNV